MYMTLGIRICRYMCASADQLSPSELQVRIEHQHAEHAQAAGGDPRRLSCKFCGRSGAVRRSMFERRLLLQFSTCRFAETYLIDCFEEILVRRLCLWRFETRHRTRFPKAPVAKSLEGWSIYGCIIRLPQGRRGVALFQAGFTDIAKIAAAQPEVIERVRPTEAAKIA